MDVENRGDPARCRNMVAVNYKAPAMTALKKIKSGRILEITDCTYIIFTDYKNMPRFHQKSILCRSILDVIPLLFLLCIPVNAGPLPSHQQEFLSLPKLCCVPADHKPSLSQKHQSWYFYLAPMPSTALRQGRGIPEPSPGD